MYIGITEFRKGEKRMAGKYVVRLFLIILAAVMFASSVYADQPSSSTDLNFTYGASLRLRQEIWDDVVALGTNTTTQKDRNFFRLRASVWGKADVGQNFDAYTRITTEPKYYLGTYHPGITGATRGQYLDSDEIIFDNIYVTGRKLFNGVVDFRLGRQDFLSPDDIYGEGFLIMDGTPGDGSRTFYFNAAKLRLNITKDNSIDFVYIDDAETDIFLPSLHPAISGNVLYVDNKKLLTTSDEQAFVVYSRNKFGKMFTFDPYYIYKIENGFGANPKLKLNTFGGRATFSSDGWRAKGELAYQVGSYDSNRTYPTGIDRTGLGGYFFFGRKFEQTPGSPEFDLGAVYLSGDNPNSNPDKRTAWDPLFSRNPYWNELYIYTLINETAVKYSGPIPGYWTNLIIYMLKGKVDVFEKTSLTLTYQYLMAAETTTGLSSTEFTNRGKERGHLPTAMLNQKFSKNLDGFLQLEYFVPGNFYTANTKDAWFFRWQLQFKL